MSNVQYERKEEERNMTSHLHISLVVLIALLPIRLRPHRISSHKSAASPQQSSESPQQSSETGDYADDEDDARKREGEEEEGGAASVMHKYEIPEGYEEEERYYVSDYAFVSVLYNEETNTYLYYTVEPYLSRIEEFFLAEISERLRNVLLFTDIEEEDRSREDVLNDKISEVVKQHHINISDLSFNKIRYYILRDFIHFGKIDVLMRDRFIEDISCNGYNIPVFVYHWKYGSVETNIVFDEVELDSFVVKIAQKGGKHLSLADPMLDVTMSDGSRAELTLGSEITTRGSTFTIRKFHEVLITPVDLVRWNTFSAEAMAYLWMCVENGRSILFVGGTASGKTTSMNAISLFIPQNAKIVTIEDTREIRLPHKNWIPGLTRDSFMGAERGAVDMYDLLRAALRQRPEYILVGEVRGKEAQTLFQAMSVGHTSFSTFHADSVDAAIHRLEYPPLSVPRSMMQALDVFSIQAQIFIGKKRVRRNMEITENLGIDPNTRNIKTIRVFEWVPYDDSFRISLYSSKVLKEIARIKACSREEIENELFTRANLLKILAENSISHEDFISIVRAYYANPDKVRRMYGL
ncbi:MAG: type II/IV secretion system ATPase subunit [Canidatus Methanoxibalbensis ujae]|nr:type II/IV secretion system ATPase subunit [Candidatus Methanoxibalbensis ujae]MCW7078156.1 type II/IV secretion system ATPase subunit [Candidatus Methanoxibalbensis ujae]